MTIRAKFNIEFGKLFDFVPETNLTEEYFYENKGSYPVFSGQTENNGIIAKINSYKDSGEMITFTTYGNGAGKMFLRKGKYTIGRNCMGLRIKSKYKNELILEWFSYRYQNLFYRLRIGEIQGQRSLNKLLLEKQSIMIPDISVQENQLNLYKSADSIKHQILETTDLLNGLTKFRINYSSREIKYSDLFNNIFNIKGGNSGLTEFFIYHNQPSTTDDGLPIYSSATLSRTLMGTIDRNAKPNKKELKIFKPPCILVARNGYAGKMNFIEKGEFTTNDHAYVITVKKKWLKKVDLGWFAFQYQELFRNIVTSKSDNATFSKESIQNHTITLPEYQKQIQISSRLKRVDKQNKELTDKLVQIEELLECEMT